MVYCHGILTDSLEVFTSEIQSHIRSQGRKMSSTVTILLICYLLLFGFVALFTVASSTPQNDSVLFGKFGDNLFDYSDGYYDNGKEGEFFHSVNDQNLTYPKNYQEYLIAGEDLPYWPNGSNSYNVRRVKFDQRIILVHGGCPRHIGDIIRRRSDVLNTVLTKNTTALVGRRNKENKNIAQHDNWLSLNHVGYKSHPIIALMKCSSKTLIHVIDYKNMADSSKGGKEFVPFCGSLNRRKLFATSDCKPVSKKQARQFCCQKHLAITFESSRGIKCSLLQEIIKQAKSAVKIVLRNNTDLTNCLRGLKKADFLFTDTLVNMGTSKKVFELCNFLDLHVDEETMKSMF